MMQLSLLRPLVVLLLSLTFSVSIASAQEQLWSVDLYENLNKVSWIEQANNGTIIAAGDKGLVGLNHQDGSIAWTLPELKAIDRSSFFNVDGMPIFYVEYSPLVGRTRGIIINAGDGTILYDTKDDDIRIKYYTFLPEQNSILFEGLKEGDRQLLNFDLKTLKIKWVVSVGKAKGLVAKLKDVSGAPASFLTQGPIFDQNGSMIMGIKDVIYAIDYDAGTVKWNVTTDKKIKALVYSETNNSLYLGIRKEKKLTILDPANGNDVTPGKLKLKGTMLDVVPDDAGNLVLVETEGFNLINPATNDLRWKKSYKIAALDEVIPYQGGFIAIGKDEKGSEIHYVNGEGDKIWDAKVKGYAYFATPSPKGVMYISTERSNILDFDSGKDVWKKDVKFRAIPAVTYDEKLDKVFLFENKTAYQFDLNSGTINVIGEDLALDDVNKKTPLVAESLEAGYFVHDEMHLNLINRSGKLVYTQAYDPLQSFDLTNAAQFAANVSGADIDIAGSMENFQALKDISNGAYRSGGKQSGARQDQAQFKAGFSFQGQYTELFNVTRTRYINSLATAEHHYLTTKMKDSGKKLILRVNKATGEVDRKIELLEKDPGYVVDQVDNVIFINEKSKLITAFKL